MSHAATKWAWEQAAPDAKAKLVLVHIAYQTSIPVIAQATGFSQATVRKKLALLRQAGLLPHVPWPERIEEGDAS